jgi:hypothetical protein
MHFWIMRKLWIGGLGPPVNLDELRAFLSSLLFAAEPFQVLFFIFRRTHSFFADCTDQIANQSFAEMSQFQYPGIRNVILCVRRFVCNIGEGTFSSGHLL